MDVKNKIVEAKSFVNKIKRWEIASSNEIKYLEEVIDRKKIPVPMLFIKDHKKKDINGEYPTRFVLPARNFACGFTNLGYRGIKYI